MTEAITEVRKGNETVIDLKREQDATLKRPALNYSFIARVLFVSMDLVIGKKTTLAKAKIIETLACIPYRSWEIRQYMRMTFNYKDQDLVDQSRKILEWGREAQDNEFWHLLIINEKMREDGIKDPWYFFPLFPFVMVFGYVLLTKFMALFNINKAFHFNAEFEDHAEHVYANFVKDNKEFENQPVKSELVKGYGDFQNWADVFRRIGLDERDHRNTSLAFCGKPEHIVHYEGMPEL
jgi:demethoxyubiquinone hydroxylase (CLK1/Coq7/Cat5 family)